MWQQLSIVQWINPPTCHPNLRHYFCIIKKNKKNKTNTVRVQQPKAAHVTYLIWWLEHWVPPGHPSAGCVAYWSEGRPSPDRFGPGASDRSLSPPADSLLGVQQTNEIQSYFNYYSSYYYCGWDTSPLIKEFGIEKCNEKTSVLN